MDGDTDFFPSEKAADRWCQQLQLGLAYNGAAIRHVESRLKTQLCLLKLPPSAATTAARKKLEQFRINEREER